LLRKWKEQWQNLLFLHLAMKKPKSKYYVVWEGHQTGIFDSWDNCKKQVDGYTAAKYKGFASLDEAKGAAGSNAWNYIGKAAKFSIDSDLRKSYGNPLKQAICVDAACSGNPGILEYRGVNMATGKEIFHRGPFAEGTNNIGEFLGIVTGLAWLKQNNLSLPLYSDSRNAIAWIIQKKANTKLVQNAKNKELFDLLDRAEEWLHNNTFTTSILKWETKAWGEIPADFGRK
jgi:ribonuclease HI